MGAVIELNKLKDQIDTNTFDNHNMTVREIHIGVSYQTSYIILQALHYAAQMGRLAAVELLVECAKVDSGSDNGKQTPLIKAGIYLQPGEDPLPQIWTLICQWSPDQGTLSLLIEAGANVSYKPPGFYSNTTLAEVSWVRTLLIN